jgi:hypothetical protein
MILGLDARLMPLQLICVYLYVFFVGVRVGGGKAYANHH